MSDLLLLESGDYLLTETGDRLLLESYVAPHTLAPEANTYTPRTEDRTYLIAPEG